LRPTTMAQQWFYKLGNSESESGPISSTELMRLAERGGIAPSDSVRNGRDGDWIKAKKIKGLFAANLSPSISVAPPAIAISPQPPPQASIPWATPLSNPATAQPSPNQAMWPDDNPAVPQLSRHGSTDGEFHANPTTDVSSCNEQHEDRVKATCAICLIVYLFVAFVVLNYEYSNFGKLQHSGKVLLAGAITAIVAILMQPKAFLVIGKWITEPGRIKRENDAKMVCPHCQSKGTVTTRPIVESGGISGGKATAALLTGGLSVLATGLPAWRKPPNSRSGGGRVAS
jgi:hypothetical protein